MSNLQVNERLGSSSNQLLSNCLVESNCLCVTRKLYATLTLCPKSLSTGRKTEASESVVPTEPAADPAVAAAPAADAAAAPEAAVEGGEAAVSGEEKKDESSPEYL